MFSLDIKPDYHYSEKICEKPTMSTVWKILVYFPHSGHGWFFTDKAGVRIVT